MNFKPGTIAVIPVGKYCFSDKNCKPRNYIFTINKAGRKCIILEHTEFYYKVLIDGIICYMVVFKKFDKFEVINNE